MYIYPDDLKAAPTLWLWRLRDLTAGGLMAVFGVVTLTQFRTPLFAAIAALYLFLTVRIEDACILDFIRKAGVYFIGRPRLYRWASPFYMEVTENENHREKKEKSTRSLMQVERITEHSIITPQGEEIVLFLLQPTNVSVLSRESLRARINALMHVLKGFVEVELLCLNSRESFEHNKRYLTGRMEQEESAPIRTLLEQDLRHLDEIQSRTATAREFMLIIRPRNIGEREMYPYLSRLEKMIREQGFTVRRAGYEDIKRILAVYFSQDVISEGYDDFDGQRWLLKGNQSDYKAASVMEEAEVLQTFLDLIAPAAIRFEVDRYMVGNTFRCVWAVRGYPTSTEEQALLQRLGERAGVTLHIYTRLVSPAEERKILQAADKANRFKGSSTDIREMVEAQSNLEDVSSMIRTAHRNREPFFHTAVYIELIARTEQEFSELRDSVEAELGRGKISVDRLHLCQQDGFLSVMPSGHNAFGEEFERMLPASSVANLFPFAYTGKTDPNGFYIGYDKYGSSIIVDLERRAADKSNANTLILGSSGKGKSYFLKLLLCNILESGKREATGPMTSSKS